jgi:hypothetical protein
MKNITAVFFIAFLIVSTVCVVRVTAAIDSFTDEATRRMIDTSKNTNALLIQMGLVADNVRRASEAQETYVKGSQAILKQTVAVLQQTEKTLYAAQEAATTVNIVTAETGKNINEQTLPTLQRDLNKATADLGQTLQTANNTLKSIDKMATNADLTQTFTNINFATTELMQMSREIAKATPELAENSVIITANVAEITKNVATYTKPKGFIKGTVIPMFISGIRYIF